MPRVYVAIGGNIEPERRFALAAHELRRRFSGILFSTCYRNPAFGFKGADFLNAVAGFDTEASADQVLADLHEIELRCGRGRDDPKWAPRAMDIDLLLYGATVAETAPYRLPRPDLLLRSYMLAPLAQIAPQLRHPLTGRSMADHWRELAREPHQLEALDLDLNALAAQAPAAVDGENLPGDEGRRGGEKNHGRGDIGR
ncbi:MAG TPA: 2-amino-4-hydroxy-6-hydroxymethyldihydropteridine diphosphokinase [Steroidobacteraceae bacterium]|nr:2-amino-4-hydroxy-6-hydroxymethyldihydropteridine diphosphokinase [Steroidobacteraceae bacterium]